jgi:glycine dehydrogenase
MGGAFLDFIKRHVGSYSKALQVLKVKNEDELIEQTIPADILEIRDLCLAPPATEAEATNELKVLAKKNRKSNSFIGQGFYGTHTPPVILRNLIENPSWYTQYTPYQPEISQGRLESLLNFQTMILDLCSLDFANASLLDEASACVEALEICAAEIPNKIILIDRNIFASSLAAIQTRARARGHDIQVCDLEKDTLPSAADVGGVLLQSPNRYGEILDSINTKITPYKDAGAKIVVATDPLYLCLATPPAKVFGADITIGSTQRFGVPLGFGGPHAAFIAVEKSLVRRMPGRMVGVSKDQQGNMAYRLTLQTREQHIRREKATSNICTAQALLANVAAMYAVYHGPQGLKKIALQVHEDTQNLANALDVKSSKAFFDTITVSQVSKETKAILDKNEIEVFWHSEDQCSISIDETTTTQQLELLIKSFGKNPSVSKQINASLLAHRSDEILTHPVFNSHHTETQLMRYLTRLASYDLSLTHSMIPLGSCTMKLNSAAELDPITWPEFSQLHPYTKHAEGYKELFTQLCEMLKTITGFDAISLQPNSGAQGEYAGLLAIARYHQSRGEAQRKVCLIPTSAHGTNPASAVVAGMNVKTVACDKDGNVDLNDLRRLCELYQNELACLMVTYPSTHGVFETGIKSICETVHKYGGQVYMDGANLNAQVGLCYPASIGADVCHLNLHKTFCIPHGGGGPGVGPIGVKKHLEAFLPSHPFTNPGSDITLTAAPFGSASILPISWMYIRMMGEAGLKRATKVAILNANYIATRLENHYKILYRGFKNRVAHECIIDLRNLQKTANITVEDVAKRLMDYGFHAPTMAWPVPGTMMIEPTESESQDELDRFCEAMIAIREEIHAIENGKSDPKNNVLKNAPHTTHVLAQDTWPYPYSRKQACFPLTWVEERKFWPKVSRIDNAFGDRNLVCSCPEIEEYE